jgi:hypothetical protein
MDVSLDETSQTVLHFWHCNKEKLRYFIFQIKNLGHFPKTPPQNPGVDQNSMGLLTSGYSVKISIQFNSFIFLLKQVKIQNPNP